MQCRSGTAELSGHIINRRSPGLRGHPSGDSTHLRGSGRPRRECLRVRRVRGHRTSPGCRYFPERPLRGPLAGTPAPGPNKMRDYGTGKHIKWRCGPCAIAYTHFTRRVSTAEKKKYKELRMNEPQAFAKLCKSEGQFLLEVHEAMKRKNVAETSVAGQPNQKAPVGQVRQEVSMTRAMRGEGPVQVHPQLPVRLRLAPAVASRDSTGTSSLLPWVRVLDPQKAPSQPGLHPDRCKARAGRDGVCCGGDGCGTCFSRNKLGPTAMARISRVRSWVGWL